MHRSSSRKRPIHIRIALLIAIFALTGYLLANSFWSPTRRDQIFGHETIYFQSESSIAPLDSYQQVFTVGHNAGYSTGTVHQARSNGANVIEIDVVLLGDQLVSAHVPQMAVIGSLMFRGATLESVWNAAGEDAVIQLDLKESSAKFRRAVIAFLKEHGADRTVLVASPNASVLADLAEETPDVLRFLSISDSVQLEQFLANEELVRLVDGVTIRYQLATADVVRVLKGHELVVLAWTVNDLATVHALVALGVDGFSTNNLSIMGTLDTPEAGFPVRFRQP